jgi:hypothetical protein
MQFLDLVVTEENNALKISRVTKTIVLQVDKQRVLMELAHYD